MGEWSQLPKELLNLISERLESSLYLLRFRSVCSSWRSSTSSIPNHYHHHHHLRFNFPIFSNDPTAPNQIHNSTFSLSKRTLFLINPPQQNQQQLLQPWLIKIGHDPSEKTQLWHPLSRFAIKSSILPPPLSFPELLDIYHLPVVDLGQEFVLNIRGPPSFSSLYMEKVVFSRTGSNSRGFVLLTIHVSGKLALFRSGDEGWSIIPDMPTPYDDVCVFKGRFFAVDGTGRTVRVGLDLDVEIVAEPVFGGDKKFLVECEGELLLVDKYLSSGYVCSLDMFGEGGGDDGDEIFELGCERAMKFGLYRLEEEERRWVELESLNGRVLFLGDDCAFCVPATDLCVAKGDCVIFRDDTFNINVLESGMGVFHLGDDRISPLSRQPDYFNLFWPPPDWVTLH
ncbi:putative F-box domain-containing protein [Lupinus albus]|uniref:Putative F-box domain-containing protein n=1 Tax=Lupinus albus TaxID=3870 RepID=A0A6A4NBQ9_LUPAL|nr:putative F-box domain-containing protein [Lupinus albus]